MSIKKYSYQGTGKAKQLLFQLAGVIAILIFTLLGSLFLFAAVNIPTHTGGVNIMDDPRVPPICFGIIFISNAWLFGLMYINLLPTIWTDESGITISVFIFFRKNIPWREIEDIAPIHSPFGYLIVNARRITAFHRLTGWIYSRTFFPSFLIAKEMEESEELIWTIRKNILDKKR